MKGPLVKKAFKMYATGNYSYRNLRDKLRELGLTNKNGNEISVNGVSTMLKNPFYMGIIRIKKTGETFDGAHESIVSKALFERVQNRIQSKRPEDTESHNFLYRRLFQCRLCGYSLIGEKQKDYIYYRCHTSDCPTTSYREDRLTANIREKLRELEFSDAELKHLRQMVTDLRAEWEDQRQAQSTSLKLQLENTTSRLDRLTDKFLDETIDESLFLKKKEQLQTQKREVEEKIAKLEESGGTTPDRIEKFLEYVQSVYSTYKHGLPTEKRDILETVTSNRVVTPEKVLIEWDIPFDCAVIRPPHRYGDPHRDAPRTLGGVFASLRKYLSVHELEI